MASKIRKLICAGLVIPGRLPWVGRPFRELARLCAGVYKDRRFLGGLLGFAWISPRASVNLRGEWHFGSGVFIDDLCVLFSQDVRSKVRIGARSSLYRGTILHVGNGAQVEIGENTHIQNACQLTAMGDLKIGRDVQVAPRCNFYPYNHSFDDLDQPIVNQPLTTKGIIIEDDVWLGVGVTVLDGVTIGRGSVVGAGSVVSKDVPPYAIACGVPAKVVGKR